MVAATPDPRRPTPGIQIISGTACLLLYALLSGGALRAEEKLPEDGLFITVANPLTSEEVERIKAKTNRNLQRTDRRIRKLVLDFNPDGRPSGTATFGECYELAKFLLRLQDVTTIAFVHHDVTRHTVLPVLACQELVMSEKAHLGDVLRGQSEPLSRSELEAYLEVAARRSRCPAVVLKMLDKDVELVEGRRQLAQWFVDRRRLKEEEGQGFVLTRQEPILPAGTAGLYTQAQAEKLGLCQLRRETRAELAERYQMPASSLRGDPLDGRTPNPRRIELRGAVNRRLSEWLQRRMRQEIARGANFFILELDCRGGDVPVARELAEFLRTLREDQHDAPVMTVAYVAERAPDTATFLALGCTEIIMGPKAELGNFESIVYEYDKDRRPREVNPERYQMKLASLVGLAEAQGYPPLLFRAMLDKNLQLRLVHSTKGPAERRLITEEEWQQDQEGERKWGNDTLIWPAGKFLKLRSEEAKLLGVSQETVEDLPHLYKHYGLKQVRDVGPDWLDGIAWFLRLPLVAFLLILVGVVCLILEIKMPGLGLPGVIAALCFVLYFWAHSQLAGQITVLAVLLFILGLILLALEVFVLPGFGVIGVSGIVLVVVSLGLVTLEKKPETTQEWFDFGLTLSTVGGSLLLAAAGAMVVGHYLPHIPYANRLVLQPPGEDEQDLAEEENAGQAQHASLLGAIGVAVTMLRPAGMARFGEEFVDVVAEGSYVPAGGRVQVVEIEGNRIVVQEV